jgi:hypothetical protein
MAKIKVEMTVSTVSQNGDFRGRVIGGWEVYNFDIKGTRYTKKRQWTAWFELPTNINKDDVIEVTGDLITKADGVEKEYQGNKYFEVQHTIQNATFVLVKAAVPVAPKPVTELTENPPF